MLPKDASDCFYDACRCLSRQNLSELSFSAQVMKKFVDKHLPPSSGMCRFVLPRVCILPAGQSFIVGPEDTQVQYGGEAQQQLQCVFNVAQYAYVKSLEVTDPQAILIDLVNFNLFRKLTATLSVDEFWLLSTNISQLAPAYFHSLLLSFPSVVTIRNSASTFAAAQITDDILRASAQRGVGLGLSGSILPVEELCPVTENAILDYCFSPQYAFRSRYLTLANANISDEFLLRLEERLTEVTHLDSVRLTLWNMPRDQRHLQHYEQILRQQYVLHVNERTDNTYYVRIQYMAPLVTFLRPFLTMLLTTDSQEFLASAPNAH